MSKYSVNQTVLREEKYLVEALKEMNYEVEVHPEGANLNSYYSEQESKLANVIIRRPYLPGAYGDIGFARQPNTQFAVVQDELDQYHGYGTKWIGHGKGKGLHPERTGSCPNLRRSTGATPICRAEVNHHA